MTSDAIGELLRRHDLRVTPQRRAILQAFRETSDEHLSAEEVMSRASATVPEIGRGTVYAALAELTELGLLAAVGTSEPIRYEVNVEPHDHFRCRLCLRIFDVDLGGSGLKRHRLTGYTIESLAVRGEGVCAQCRAFERGLRDGAAQVVESELVAPAALDALACLSVPSPLGDLSLAGSAEGIVRIAFSGHADFETLSARARTRRGSTAGRARVIELRATLQSYLEGNRVVPGDLVDWRLVSDEQRRTLIAVQQIPWARPRSYDRLDSALGAYDRGRLLGANPIPLLVPCHRVARGTERPPVYVGGPERLRFLQALESGS